LSIFLIPPIKGHFGGIFCILSIENDCANVVKLLEENKIHLEKYRFDTYDRPTFIRYDHQMEIKGFEVKAVFYKSPETGEIFLNDAWVVTK
jgi:hypothetical protein